MRYPAALLLILASGCLGPSGPPLYMTDAVRGEEEGRRALERMRDELGSGFETRVVDEIFFLASNGGARGLELAESTVRRTTEDLYRIYFSRRPTRAVRVYCFRDDVTYDAYVLGTYGRPPSTPYGFYMASERKVVLNLGTGVGTLQHEIVHPLLGEDFPEAPAWFNEGFASLFEQTSRDANGTLIGRNNWRLVDLKRAKRDRREVPLRTLMETDADTFYGDERGVHYAMARYFCLYLQKRKLLDRYYKEFRATAGADPTGKAALERVTRTTLAAFEAEWRSWVDEQVPRRY